MIINKDSVFAYIDKRIAELNASKEVVKDNFTTSESTFIDGMIKALTELKENFQAEATKHDKIFQDFNDLFKEFPFPKKEDDRYRWPVFPNMNPNKKGCTGNTSCPMMFMVIPPQGTTCSVCGETRHGNQITC